LPWFSVALRFWHSRATSKKRGNCCPSAAIVPDAASSSRSPFSTTASACMRFSVRVPVLSVQITVVEPKVSTAGRCRIRTFLRAMRWAAMASESVTVGNSPSGTFATMMPMAKIKLAQNGKPIARPRAKNTTPSTTESTATTRLTNAISRWRGNVISRVV
jgi:hypothetical protein